MLARGKICYVTAVICARCIFFFFFQAEDGIRYLIVTGVQTCALPICQVRERGERLEPLTTLAYLAAMTSRVRLGTAVLLPALRQPVVLAHQIANVDALSQIGRAACRGRGEISVGAGSFKKKKKNNVWC